MAVIKPSADVDLVIDLDAPPSGHRLTELLQALTGCSAVEAELVIDDPMPDPIAADDAVATLARSIVVTRARRASVAHAQA
jgi:hypothetical protein